MSLDHQVLATSMFTGQVANKFCTEEENVNHLQDQEHCQKRIPLENQTQLSSSNQIGEIEETIQAIKKELCILRLAILKQKAVVEDSINRHRLATE